MSTMQAAGSVYALPRLRGRVGVGADRKFRVRICALPVPPPAKGRSRPSSTGYAEEVTLRRQRMHSPASKVL
jgi:hypothetical protein